MSTIDIRDFQEFETELVIDDMIKIRGGKVVVGSVHSYDEQVSIYPSEPSLPSVPSVDQLLQDAFSHFPDVFSDVPGFPSYPNPVPVLDPGIGNG